MNTTVAVTKSLKNSGLNGIRTHDHCDTGALPINDLPVIGDLRCANDSGIAKGQTLKVSRKKCTTKRLVFVKSGDIGQRIMHFRREFVSHGGG